MDESPAAGLPDPTSPGDEIGGRCSMMLAGSYDSEDKQNVKVILVSEDVLQALRISGCTVLDASSNKIPDCTESVLINPGQVSLNQVINQVQENDTSESSRNLSNRTLGNLDAATVQYLLQPSTQFLAVDANDCLFIATLSGTEDSLNQFAVVSDASGKILTLSPEKGNSFLTLAPKTDEETEEFPNSIVLNSQPLQHIVQPTTSESLATCVPITQEVSSSLSLDDSEISSLGEAHDKAKQSIAQSQALQASTQSGNNNPAPKKDMQIQTTEPGIYTCGFFNCVKTFRSFQEYEEHRANHLLPKPYKCTYEGCSWTFKTPYKLKRHMQSHDQNKQFQCKYSGCHKVCSTSYNLRVHEKTIHKDRCLQCDKCQQIFISKHKLLKHLRQLHNVEPDFPCCFENCDRKFYTPGALASHVKAHKNHKELICTMPDCGKKFKRPCIFREHVMSHSGVKPYKCDYPDCKWTFTTMTKLKRHKMIHMPVKRILCPVESCQSRFHRLEHLKSHMRVHSAKIKDAKDVGVAGPELPIESSEDNLVYYLCPYEECGSLFTTLIGAKQHIQKIHRSNTKLCSDQPASLDSDPVSISLGTAMNSDSETNQAVDGKVSIVVSGDLPENETEKKNDVSDVDPDVHALLSTIMQSQSSSNAPGDILIDNMASTSSSGLDTVPQQLEFVTIDTTSQSYSPGETLELSAVPNIALSAHEPISSQVDPTQYFLGASGDFVSNSSSVSSGLQDPDAMDFMSISQSIYPASTSADQFLNFGECVTTVDPNIVMSVPEPLVNQSSSRGYSGTTNSSTDEEDNASSSADGNLGGSARTDCNAYHRARLGKQSKSSLNESHYTSSDVSDGRRTDSKPRKPRHHFDVTMSFMLNDAKRKKGMPNLEDETQLRSCETFYKCDGGDSERQSTRTQYKDLENLGDCDRDFPGSTINLSDLA